MCELNDIVKTGSIKFIIKFTTIADRLNENRIGDELTKTLTNIGSQITQEVILANDKEYYISFDLTVPFNNFTKFKKRLPKLCLFFHECPDLHIEGIHQYMMSPNRMKVEIFLSMDEKDLNNNKVSHSDIMCGAIHHFLNVDNNIVSNK